MANVSGAGTSARRISVEDAAERINSNAPDPVEFSMNDDFYSVLIDGSLFKFDQDEFQQLGDLVSVRFVDVTDRQESMAKSIVSTLLS
jgi:hypothetical protein